MAEAMRSGGGLSLLSGRSNKQHSGLKNTLNDIWTRLEGHLDRTGGHNDI